MKKGISFESMVGLYLALAGLCVLTGLRPHFAEWTKWVPGTIAIGLNSSFCLVVAGTWLSLQAIDGAGRRLISILLAMVLVLSSGSVLLEHLFGTELYVGVPTIYTFFFGSYFQNGRMAPNTSVAFLIAGCAFLLIGARHRYRYATGAATLLTYAVLSIAISGLLGYALQLEWLYQWYKFNHMAFSSAFFLCLLGVAMLAHLHRIKTKALTATQYTDKRIMLLSTGILTIAAAIFTLTGFAILRQSVEQALSDGLMQAARGSSIFLESTLNQHLLMARLITTRPALLSHLEKLNIEPGNPESRAFIEETQKGVVSLGFTGISIADNSGRSVGSAGVFSKKPELAVKLLNQKEDISLYWDEGFVLHSRIDIVGNGVRQGTAVVEQRLGVVTDNFSKTPDMGMTGEYKICFRAAEFLQCFPSRLVPFIHRLPFTEKDEPALPAARAVLGQSGVVKVVDFRMKKVVAAYAPVGATGIGLVAKMDTSELYASLRSQLGIMLALFAAVVVGSTFALRSFIKPLASKLVESERESRSSSDALSQALTSLKETTDTLRANEERMRVIIENAHDAFVGMDTDGLIIDWSPQAEATFGWKKEEVIGRPLEDFIIPLQFREAHRKGLKHFMATGDAVVINKRLELSALRRNGEEFPVELTISLVRHGETMRFASFLHDITERKIAEQRLTYLAQYDALTGVPNRSLFLDRLNGALLRAQRNQTAMALFFIDMDKFKQVNDTLGHHAGDLLLRGFTERLKQSVRKTDTISRLAGDEFTVILEVLAAPITDAEDIAIKIVQKMAVPFNLSDQQVMVTVSIGIAICENGSIMMDEIIRQADTAMYRAKERGGNQFCFYQRMT